MLTPFRSPFRSGRLGLFNISDENHTDGVASSGTEGIW